MTLCPSLWPLVPEGSVPLLAEIRLRVNRKGQVALQTEIFMDGTSNRVGGGIYSPDRMILQKNVALKNPKKLHLLHVAVLTLSG